MDHALHQEGLEEYKGELAELRNKYLSHCRLYEAAKEELPEEIKLCAFFFLFAAVHVILLVYAKSNSEIAVNSLRGLSFITCFYIPVYLLGFVQIGIIKIRDRCLGSPKGFAKVFRLLLLPVQALVASKTLIYVTATICLLVPAVFFEAQGGILENFHTTVVVASVLMSALFLFTTPKALMVFYNLQEEKELLEKKILEVEAKMRAQIAENIQNS